MNGHQKTVVNAGQPIERASRVLIMIHGRGASAEDILSLSQYLAVDDFALIAPRATQNTWYPHSFLAPPSQNEPWLSSALNILDQIVTDVSERKGTENLYLLGFSQGACLTLEFAARNARRYGGVVAFTGGLIGDVITPSNYTGKFENTPVFIGSSDPDPHVPVERVHQTADIMTSLGASVTKKVYKNMGHTISADEISLANDIVFSRER